MRENTTGENFAPTMNKGPFDGVEPGEGFTVPSSFCMWEKKRRRACGQVGREEERREGRLRVSLGGEKLGGLGDVGDDRPSKSVLRGDRNIPNRGGCQGALAGKRLPARRVLSFLGVGWAISTLFLSPSSSLQSSFTRRALSLPRSPSRSRSHRPNPLQTPRRDSDNTVSRSAVTDDEPSRGRCKMFSVTSPTRDPRPPCDDVELSWSVVQVAFDGFVSVAA